MASVMRTLRCFLFRSHEHRCLAREVTRTRDGRRAVRRLRGRGIVLLGRERAPLGLLIAREDARGGLVVGDDAVAVLVPPSEKRARARVARTPALARVLGAVDDNWQPMLFALSTLTALVTLGLVAGGLARWIGLELAAALAQIVLLVLIMAWVLSMYGVLAAQLWRFLHSRLATDPSGAVRERLQAEHWRIGLLHIGHARAVDDVLRACVDRVERLDARTEKRGTSRALVIDAGACTSATALDGLTNSVMSRPAVGFGDEQVFLVGGAEQSRVTEQSAVRARRALHALLLGVCLVLGGSTALVLLGERAWCANACKGVPLAQPVPALRFVVASLLNADMAGVVARSPVVDAFGLVLSAIGLGALGISIGLFVQRLLSFNSALDLMYAKALGRSDVCPQPPERATEPDRAEKSRSSAPLLLLRVGPLSFRIQVESARSRCRRDCAAEPPVVPAQPDSEATSQGEDAP